MSAPFSVQIVDTTYQEDATWFTIQVSPLPSGVPWTLKKRYSQFDQLREVFLADKITVGRFPPKKLLRTNSAEVVQQRRQELEFFLTDVVLPNWTHTAVVDFLDLEMRARTQQLRPEEDEQRVVLRRNDFERILRALRSEEISGPEAARALEEAAGKGGDSGCETPPKMERSGSSEMLLPRHKLYNLGMEQEVAALQLMNTTLTQQLAEQRSPQHTQDPHLK